MEPQNPKNPKKKLLSDNFQTSTNFQLKKLHQITNFSTSSRKSDYDHFHLNTNSNFSLEDGKKLFSEFPVVNPYSAFNTKRSNDFDRSSYFSKMNRTTTSERKIFKTDSKIFNNINFTEEKKDLEQVVNKKMIKIQKTFKETLENVKQFKFEKKLEDQINLLKTLLDTKINKSLDRFILFPESEFEGINFLLEVENSFCHMLQNICKIFTNLTEEKNQVINKLNEYERKILELETNASPKREEENMMKTQKNWSHNNTILNLENQKLEKFVQSLQENLKVYENTHDVKKFVQELNEYKRKTEEKIADLVNASNRQKNIVYAQTNLINALKHNLIQIEKDLAKSIQENQEILSQFSEITKQSSIFEEKSRQSYEIALMQKEECESYHSENQRIFKSMLTLDNELLKFKKKFGENFNLLGLLNEDDFEKDNSILSSIYGVMGNAFKRKLNTNDSSPVFKKRRKEEVADLFDDIVLSKYQYFKPSFASLMPSEQISLDSKLSPLFMGTLRAILDSKYNEYLLNNDYRLITKFPDFVYSWISNFHVSIKTRRIRSIGTDNSDVHELRQHFLNCLRSPLINKLWECTLFREFLEEKSSADEILFVLHCRFLMNRGPELKNDGSTFNYINFLRYDYVLFVLDLIMENFDKDYKIFIKSKLKEKTKIKNSQEYIDCYYVLRLLLEYYRFDRKVRFKLLTDSFHSLPNEHINRKSLTLKSFKAFKIMIEKNFPHTTELQKAELFRECFQIGQGEISFDVFFTVLSESNYFVTTLKLKSFLTLPLNVAANLTKSGNKTLSTILSKEDFLKNSESVVEKLAEEKLRILLVEIRKNLEELGNETLANKFEFEIKRFSEKYRYLDYADYWGKVPELSFLYIIETFIKNEGMNIVNGHLRDELYSEFGIVNRDWELLEQIMNLGGKNINMEARNEFIRNKKAKILQHFMKTKSNKWYSIIRQMIKKPSE